MSTLKERYVEHFSAIAADYHRDFTHNKNAKQPDDTTWRTCQAGRCEQFRKFVDSFPGSIDDEMTLIGHDLKHLQTRVNAAVAALATEPTR